MAPMALSVQRFLAGPERRASPLLSALHQRGIRSSRDSLETHWQKRLEPKALEYCMLFILLDSLTYPTDGTADWALPCATIDILFTILWVAASIAVAVWNANGIAKGKDSSDSDNSSDKNTRRDDSNKSDGTCASFGYGSESKCEVSKASVGFGIVIMLLFYEHSCSVGHISMRKLFLPDTSLPSPLFMPSIL